MNTKLNEKSDQKACENSPFGTYYVTDECMNLCQSCLQVAPENLNEGDEIIQVCKQPQSQAEVDELEEAARICPADAIQCIDNPVNKE